jgi:aryl-alcohol dehydrogenase-like predicted oxidoreductase
MDVTRTAYGTWNGGRFMHYGEPVDEDRYLRLIRLAYEKGIRTFMTADVYGNGAADEMLGRALAGIPRDTYCLVGAIGHDFYTGKREGSKGFPRFTHPALRGPDQYASYLRMATEKLLARCQTSKLDLVLLHNPDSIGYSSDAVWKGMTQLQEAGLVDMLGIAPGPANGFTLDIISCIEKFGSVMDWAMIILNPLEPWPGNMCLPAAEKNNVKIMTRVVDYGGVFHDDVKPGHTFGHHDHRSFRPPGWVEAGCEKAEKMRSIAEAHGLTMLQLACVWDLSQPAVQNVIPTLIQETGPDAKLIEKKVEELASLPNIKLTPEESRRILEIGNNKGCMTLKGGNPEHQGDPLPDRWSVTPELQQIGQRWDVVPERDLVCTHR